MRAVLTTDQALAYLALAFCVGAGWTLGCTIAGWAWGKLRL